MSKLRLPGTFDQYVVTTGQGPVYGPFRSALAAYAWAEAEPAVQAGWLVQKLIEPRVLEVQADVG